VSCCVFLSGVRVMVVCVCVCGGGGPYGGVGGWVGVIWHVNGWFVGFLLLQPVRQCCVAAVAAPAVVVACV